MVILLLMFICMWFLWNGIADYLDKSWAYLVEVGLVVICAAMGIAMVISEIVQVFA